MDQSTEQFSRFISGRYDNHDSVAGWDILVSTDLTNLTARKRSFESAHHNFGRCRVTPVAEDVDHSAAI
jgi:hypothetical protein